MNTETIKIKYHTDEIEKLRYIDGKSDFIDLRSAEDVELKAGDFKLISLGVSMELPKGYEAHIVPRSSTFKTWGILQTNSMGIVDESYRSDNDIWKMPVYATRDTIIHRNDRICQFRIMKHQPSIEFEEVEHLEGEERGGFGSTGKQQYITIKSKTCRLFILLYNANGEVVETKDFTSIGVNQGQKTMRQYSIHDNVVKAEVFVNYVYYD